MHIASATRTPAFLLMLALLVGGSGELAAQTQSPAANEAADAPGQGVTASPPQQSSAALRVVSNPSGAQVMIDGENVGVTPWSSNELALGAHLVTVRHPDYAEFEEQVELTAGDSKIVSARLQRAAIGPSAEELERERRSLTAFGARALPRGRSTASIAAGYPYWLDGRILVGAGELAEGLGFDAGLVFRTFFSRTELGLTGRLTLVDVDPFSVGTFATLGGGSNFFDDSGRNSFFFDGGLLASLTGLGSVTITGRSYLSFWSDSFCPGVSGGQLEGDPTELCEDYKAFLDGMPTPGFTAADKARIDDLVGEDGLLERDNGLRLMVSLIVEIAVKEQWNVFVLFEGAPFQGERAAFKDALYGIMLENDVGTYLQLGVTYKF